MEDETPYKAAPGKTPVENRNKCYTQNHFPPPKNGEWWTEEVIITDHSGNLFTAYYNYDMSCWLSCDHKPLDELRRFNWIYRPEYLKDVEPTTELADDGDINPPDW